MIGISDICGESRFSAMKRVIVNFRMARIEGYGIDKKKEVSVTYDIHLLAYPKCVIITN